MSGEEIFEKPKAPKWPLRFRMSARQLFLAAASVLLLSYLSIRMIPPASVFIFAEDYVFENKCRTYFFRKEEFAVVQSPVEFLVSEGDKIAAYTLLSNQYIDGTVYLKERIASIDWLLANPGVTDKSDVYGEIEKMQAAITIINSELFEQWDLLTSEDRESKQNEMEALKRDRLIMIRALQHAGLNAGELLEIKEVLLSGPPAGASEFNCYTLNLDTFGYFSSSLDGYEDYMNFSDANNVTGQYLDFLDGLKPKNISGDFAVIKSSSTRQLMIVARVDADIAVQGAQRAVEKRHDILLDYDMSREGGYYEFLFRREDLLASFPAVTLSFPSSPAVSGRIVHAAHTQGEDEQYLFIAVNSTLEPTLDKRIENATLLSSPIRAFVVPQTSLTQQDGQYYVTVLYNSNIKKNIAVNIYDAGNGQAILRVSENSDLTDGMELLVKGRRN